MRKCSLPILLALSIALFLGFSSPNNATREKGVLILAFDDGSPTWLQAVAPELAAVGGVATGYVNNHRIHHGEISFEDLVQLQDQYKWEIGTHTYNHFNAPDFVKKNGVEKWLTEEVDAAVKELEEHEIEVSSLVFPYNAFTRELARAVYQRFTCFRRLDTYPIADGRQANGSVPGSPIDVAGYAPVELVCQWVDEAARSRQILFLYGHHVLPDSEFFVGQVAGVSGAVLTSAEEIGIKTGRPDLFLVPDTSRRVLQRSFTVEAIEGKSIKVRGLDLTRFTAPGASFLVGPGYGTRVSDFKRIIEYASRKLQFKNMRDGLKGDNL